MASIRYDQDTAALYPPVIAPEETYHGPFPASSPIALRIATGGAGQSGLLKALADAFITHLSITDPKLPPFSIAWLKSDTSQSFNYLASAAADLSITYHAQAENIAITQGFADNRAYAWRDHWLLVGPVNNPAGLPVVLHPPRGGQTIYTLFATLFRAAIETSQSEQPVRFLSRYDKSACNIKESSIWCELGQTPWAEPASDWYHMFCSFPFAALEKAAELEQYTLTDRGTWYSSPKEVTGRMKAFMEGEDDEEDVALLNPAHLLVGRYGKFKDMANRFARWMVSREGGQEVVRTFEVNGVVLYTMVPGMN